MNETEEKVWVACTSHRARRALHQRVYEPGPQYGVWPPDGGWPRGEYYELTRYQADKIKGVKGLKIMARAPRGDIFKRVTGL